MDLNKVMIIGNLTRDPETRTTSGGQTVTSFGMATNLVWTDQSGQRQSKPEFHNIVAWRKLGEICAQYLKKGGKIYLEGRIQTREWEGTDGVKRNRTEIVADNMIMLGGRDGGSPAGGSFTKQPASRDEGVQPEPPIDEAEIKVEDIPF